MQRPHTCPHNAGYFVSTIGKHGDEKMISNYVKKQGRPYEKLHEARQLRLF